MKITKRQLRRIIKEEASKVHNLKEGLEYAITVGDLKRKMAGLGDSVPVLMRIGSEEIPVMELDLAEPGEETAAGDGYEELPIGALIVSE
jgi:hypothetical protein